MTSRAAKFGRWRERGEFQRGVLLTGRQHVTGRQHAGVGGMECFREAVVAFGVQLEAAAAREWSSSRWQGGGGVSLALDAQWDVDRWRVSSAANP